MYVYCLSVYVYVAYILTLYTRYTFNRQVRADRHSSRPQRRAPDRGDLRDRRQRYPTSLSRRQGHR